ncbi:MAG: hypothetical protein S4CHLAM6_08010 [Chlamydiae bacterium]|nr:hypothetical protein [Chlamydiota bacterium]
MLIKKSAPLMQMEGKLEAALNFYGALNLDL